MVSCDHPERPAKRCREALAVREDLKKKGRGAFDSVVEANSGVTVVRWFDNGLVQMVSNFIGGDVATQARRWSKKERRFINIERPAMVVEYNSHMGVLIYVTCYSRCTESAIGLPNITCTSFFTALVWLW